MYSLISCAFRLLQFLAFEVGVLIALENENNKNERQGCEERDVITFLIVVILICVSFF